MPLYGAVLYGITFGTLGAFISHWVWLVRVERSLFEAGRLPSGSRKWRSARMGLAVGSLLPGMALGFGVGFVGHLLSLDAATICVGALVAGAAPEAFLRRGHAE